MAKKVIIVGGVAGGASAAARLRRLDEQAEIILLERDEHISFANCGLPYYIGGTIQERDNLLVQTPAAMRGRFAIDVRTHSEAIALHPERKTISIRHPERGEYEESYDVLVLSPGAKPLRPPIPGIESSRIFTLRNIPDTDRIKAYTDRHDTKRAIIIGGGFIGVEMAENLRERGLEISLIEAAPHILAPFDGDMALLAENELRDNGVSLYLGDGVSAFTEDNDAINVQLQSGAVLTADFVVLAIGVTPDTVFLQGSGIALGPRGHIRVNAQMQTSVPDIYAVGDAVEVKDFLSQEPAAIPLAGPANKQGRIAADNIVGIPSIYQGSQGTSILKIFSLTAAATGHNERLLTRRGIAYHTILLHPNSHASYYPNALPLTLKLLFGDDGQIFGAQAIGAQGIDKHIDVIATVLRLKGTINDLTALELSYAPPFSSAKDPVNMAGFVAENILAGHIDVFTYDQLANFDPDVSLLIDVRSDLEFANGHLPGAVNIPTNTLRSRLAELPKDKQLLVYCKVGIQSYIASRILKQHGFNVKSMTGGYSSASPHLRKANTASTSQLQTEQATPALALHNLDATGLSCPGPLMKVKAKLDEISNGETVKIIASDPGFREDIKAWCERTGNTLLSVTKENQQIIAFVKKGNSTSPVETVISAPVKDNKTIVVFSGDLDKALASFVIANGATAMGKKVTLFFTFWGLNILRKPEPVSVTKNLIDRMFGWMMPRGSRQLKLSNMHMLGMGTEMMRRVMQNKNIASLEELIQSAQAAGVELVACQMSMDVMGLRQEELIDGVKIGGVGYYLSQAEDANVNLFI